MTKVQVTLKLSRPLNDQDLTSLSRVHAVYGIFVAKVMPALDELFVEYDASRLNLKEVRETFEKTGIPLV